MNNIKKFLFLLPIIIIIGIVTQLLTVDKKVGLKPPLLGINRDIASVKIANNLAFSFRKINAQQKLEQNGLATDEFFYESEEETIADLNYLSNRYFFDNKFIDQATFQKQDQEIRLRISKNPKLYDEILKLQLEDSLLANNNNTSIQMFALASSLPLGPSSMQYSSEKILIDLVSMDREWDEELFKNALQFYYIQNFIKNERNDTLLTDSLEKCKNEKLKQRVLRIDREINIYAKNE